MEAKLRCSYPIKLAGLRSSGVAAVYSRHGTLHPLMLMQLVPNGKVSCNHQLSILG